MILTLSGVLVPAGLRLCVSEMIKSGWVHAIISTGASLEEGISWGKVKPQARLAAVVCDCTIAFPLIVSALKEEFV